MIIHNVMNFRGHYAGKQTHQGGRKGWEAERASTSHSAASSVMDAQHFNRPARVKHTAVQRNRDIIDAAKLIDKKSPPKIKTPDENAYPMQSGH